MKETILKIMRNIKPSNFFERLNENLQLVRPIYLALISIALFISVNANFTMAADGDIVDRKVYVFPNYEEAEKNTDVEIYASKQEYENAVKDSNFELEKLKYMSDGLKVVAYLYKPRKMESKKYPVIIFNRGSGVRGDIAPELVSFFHRLASEGFVILAPLYRQSDGGEGKDELGGQDVNDLMNIVPVSKSLDFIDSTNLFMYGESRGGGMALQAARNGFPANSVATFGAITDLEVYWADNFRTAPPQYRQDPKKTFPDYETRKEEIIKLRSSIYWAEKLNTPLLIMHGGNDRAVNPSHALNLAQQLQKLGKIYELLIYAQDTHILSRNKVDRDARAIAWFKKHMKK